MPRINLSKIGSASAAVATGAILAIAPVFAQTTPTAPAPAGESVITLIIEAANAASLEVEVSAPAAAEVEVKTGVDENVEEDLDVDEEADHQPVATAAVVKTTVHTQTQHSAAGAEHESN